MRIALLDGRSPLGGAPLHGPTRAVLTPHLNHVAAASYRRIFADALEDIATFAEGGLIRGLGLGDRVEAPAAAWLHRRLPNL